MKARALALGELSYRRHRFPPVVIQHAVWLYLRFTLSYRDVEDLSSASVELNISYETIRSWVLKFGPVIARRLRCRSRPSNRWHLDEMVVRIWPIRAANVPGRGSRLSSTSFSNWRISSRCRAKSVSRSIRS
jgi:hypothetical protein